MRCALSWIVFAGVLTAALGTFSFYTARCPPTNRFAAVFPLIADAIAPESVTIFNSTTGLPFLRNIMSFSERN